VAQIFRSSCRSIDMAARCGGDEFALVLPEAGEKEAELVAKRIHEMLANDKEKPALSVSVGIGIYPRDGETIETLMHTADCALYRMKRH
jgi:diguanylate cyclase (GGDEF)-like protein